MAAFSCHLCGKSFLTKEKLKIHGYSHSRERPFKCTHPDCGKGFVSRYKLMRHMATHSPQKTHQCTHCEKTFNRKDHLKNHLQTHDPNKVCFECEDCGKKYHTMLGYKRHTALHSASSGDLTCGVCSQELVSTEVLLEHLKGHAEEKSSGHTKEKKHQCDHCSRSFYTRKDVRRHLVVHTGCKDFLCQFCAQRFGRKDHLTRHTKKTHSQELMKESMQAGGELMTTFHPIPPPFQLKAPAMAPFPMGPPVQNGYTEVHTLTLAPPEQIMQPMQPLPPLPETLVSLHPMVDPNTPPPMIQNPKYNAEPTSYPLLASMPLKADTKDFCNIGVYEEFPMQEPQSPKFNPSFELPKGVGGPAKVTIPKELTLESINITIPASLDISSLLSFWQLPPPPLPPQNFGNGTITIAPPGESLPLLNCIGQQLPPPPPLPQQQPPQQQLPPQQLQQLPPQQPPQQQEGAPIAVSLGQLPLPPIPHMFTAGTTGTILPHFHHAFR